MDHMRTESDGVRKYFELWLGSDISEFKNKEHKDNPKKSFAKAPIDLHPTHKW